MCLLQLLQSPSHEPGEPGINQNPCRMVDLHNGDGTSWDANMLKASNKNVVLEMYICVEIIQYFYELPAHHDH
jgi:hypothetical protein